VDQYPTKSDKLMGIHKIEKKGLRFIRWVKTENKKTVELQNSKSEIESQTSIVYDINQSK